MRTNARLSAERVDFESAIIGQGRDSRAIEIEPRLEQRVVEKRRAGLFGSLGNSQIGERQQFKLDTDIAQNQSILGKLRAVGRRDQ